MVEFKNKFKEIEKIQKKYCKVREYVLLYISVKYRGVAQLVARVVWDHEVAGSIPVASTKKWLFFNKIRKNL